MVEERIKNKGTEQDWIDILQQAVNVAWENKERLDKLEETVKWLEEDKEMRDNIGVGRTEAN